MLSQQYSEIIQKKREVHQLTIRRQEKGVLLKRYRDKILKDVIERTDHIHEDKFIVQLFEFIVRLFNRNFDHIIHQKLKFLYSHADIILRSQKIRNQIKNVLFVKSLFFYISLFRKEEILVHSCLEILILLSSFDELEDQFDTDFAMQQFSKLISKNTQSEAQIIWIMGNLLYSKKITQRAIIFLRYIKIEQIISQHLKKIKVQRDKSQTAVIQNGTAFSSMKNSIFHFLTAYFRYSAITHTALNLDFQILVSWFIKTEFYTFKSCPNVVNALLPLLRKCHFSQSNQLDLKIINITKIIYNTDALKFILELSYRYDWINFDLIDNFQSYSRMIMTDQVSANDIEQILKILVNVSLNSNSYENTDRIYELIKAEGFRKLWKISQGVREEAFYLIAEIIRLSGAFPQIKNLTTEALQQQQVNSKTKLQLIAVLKREEISEFSKGLCERQQEQQFYLD